MFLENKQRDSKEIILENYRNTSDEEHD